jgi:ADP-heptose:LPS heptosyltransferase
MGLKKIIIINLTRMGDILQTSPLMAALKEKYPESTLTLLANSAFSEICRGIPFIDEVITFNMKGFRERMIKDEYSLVANYLFLEDFISRIDKKKYDLAINLTHSPASALISSLIHADEVRGFSVDSEGHRVIRHPWMRYFFNVVPNRAYNPYHIADIYLKIGEVVPEEKGLFFRISEEDEKSIECLMNSMGIEKGTILVGFQLGASKTDRRWPLSYFTDLAKMIINTFDAKIVLFGSDAETDLAEEFEGLSRIKTINLTGKTSLGELAAVLKRCSLLISNDTGPLHMATAVGTKTIGLFSVNAHHTETGPYGEGHYVLEAELPCLPCGYDVECRDMQCKYIIKPEAVFEIVKETVGDIPANYDSSMTVWKDIKVMKSHFAEDGCISYYPLIKRNINKSALYRMTYRYVWNKECGLSMEESENAAGLIFNEIQRHYDYENIDELISSLQIDIHDIKNLSDLASEGDRKIGRIISASKEERLDMEKIRSTWEEIVQIDNEIEFKGYAIPAMRPVIIIFTYAKEALEGEDLQLLSEAYGRIYEELAKTLNKMQSVLTGIIKLFKSRSETGQYEVVQCK